MILGSSAIKCYSCTYASAAGVKTGTDCKDGSVSSSNSIDCPTAGLLFSKYLGLGIIMCPDIQTCTMLSSDKVCLEV